MNCPNCGKPGAHFVPPSCGEPGFFICDMKTIHEPAPSAATVETPLTDALRKEYAQWIHGQGEEDLYNSLTARYEQLERSLTAKTAELEEAKALQKEQLDIVAGCGPITCRNGKQHERHDGCMYCDLAASQQRCEELEKVLVKTEMILRQMSHTGNHQFCTSCRVYEEVQQALTQQEASK